MTPVLHSFERPSTVLNAGNNLNVVRLRLSNWFSDLDNRSKTVTRVKGIN